MEHRHRLEPLKRYALISLGSCCVALGIVGVFVPILPTTPFLLLAAALYARSSQRFYDWLLSRPYLGEYVRAYREGRGLSRAMLAFTLGLLWLVLGLSAAFATDLLWLRLALLAVGLAVSVHVLHLAR